MPSDKQRRAAERRRLQRQAQRRREQAHRRRRMQLIASIIGALMVVAVVITVIVMGNDDNATPTASTKSPTPTATPSASTSPSASSSAKMAATYPCTWQKTTTQKIAHSSAVPNTTRPPRTGIVTVSLTTTQGPMTFRLNRAEAPCTVESFVWLAQHNYFNSTPCHRLVTTGFYVLQCGDPTGTGEGGPGYTIPDEGTANGSYTAATIAMARNGYAHSGGSQFFIVYKNSPALAQAYNGHYYTIFGTVSRGIGVVDKVAKAGSNNANGTGDGKPKLPITIERATVG